MNRQRFFVYLAVGISAYLIEMGSLYFFKNIWILPDVAAVAMSFWIGFAVAFVLQKWVTFKNNDKQPKVITKQLIGYSVLTVWNYAFTLGAVALFSQIASVFVIRTMAIAVITVWNYAIYRTVIFKTSDEHDHKK